MRGHDISETEPIQIDVCTATCGLHGHCLLTGNIEIAAVELLYHIIVKEEGQPHVEHSSRNDSKQRRPSRPAKYENLWPELAQWPKKGAGPAGHC